MTARTPGPWTLGAGRTIETPRGTFYLTYFTDPKTGKPSFDGFCELDDIARDVANLPNLTAENAALREALQRTVALAEHAVLHGNIYGFDGAIIQDIASQARAALAQGKGRE